MPGRPSCPGERRAFSNSGNTSSNYGYLRINKFYQRHMHQPVVPKPVKHFVHIALAFLLFVICTGSKAQSVFITRTGEKYHEGSCVHLHASKIPITLSEAKKRGYSACSVCRPDTPVSPAADVPSRKDSTTTEQQASTQCTATTKAGARCKRAAGSNGRCWQHP